MLLLVSNCSQQFYNSLFSWNHKIWVALFKSTKTNSILIRTPLMFSSKTGAPKPTGLSGAWNLNSALSEWTDYKSHLLNKLTQTCELPYGRRSWSGWSGHGLTRIYEILLKIADPLLLKSKILSKPESPYQFPGHSYGSVLLSSYHHK